MLEGIVVLKLTRQTGSIAQPLSNSRDTFTFYWGIVVHTHIQHGWLVGWLVGWWLVGWWVGWLVG